MLTGRFELAKNLLAGASNQVEFAAAKLDALDNIIPDLSRRAHALHAAFDTLADETNRDFYDRPCALPCLHTLVTSNPQVAPSSVRAVCATLQTGGCASRAAVAVRKHNSLFICPRSIARRWRCSGIRKKFPVPPFSQKYFA